ncbi:hypothetical protein DSO57_1001127 [Entomophthora muscae]|uniref:Uncharacterized protein n=1 Tax=Entomophthora muscae TaxID=34485 RepID=A0ACC2S065_9FUNG|nr:hypothetical protein DSO57_1001127 [Entomophthora muscae]
MSDLWLNYFHSYSSSIDDQPQCDRNTLINGKPTGGLKDSSMSWDTFGSPIKATLPQFHVLKPNFDDSSITELLHVHEWLGLMVHAEPDREV